VLLKESIFGFSLSDQASRREFRSSLGRLRAENVSTSAVKTQISPEGFPGIFLHSLIFETHNPKIQVETCTSNGALQMAHFKQRTSSSALKKGTSNSALHKAIFEKRISKNVWKHILTLKKLEL